jgi:DNA polymerase-1
MENEGIRCDKGKLLAADEAITRRLEAVTAEIHNQAGSIFNIDNTQCLGAVLYERLKLSDDPPRTRTGLYATDESALSALPNHPMIEAVLEYRRLVTLKRSYLNALPQSIRPDTGRIHTTFEQLESANGRLISRNPNLQNIPIASEEGRDIRRAFIPRDERFLILSADYSQLELRLLAHFCGDETLLRAFRCGTDVHTATASRVFNVPVEQVTELMRAEAKAINYGIAYGMSAFGLAKRTGRSIKESRSTIDDYFARMPRIQEYSDRIVFQARRQGFVTTICGRRRYIPEIKDRNFSVRRRSERIAVCSPIQGSAADLIKLAMISIHRAIRERNLKTRLLLQVHDELVFDLYRPEQSEVVELVTEKMETALNLAAPLTVNIGCGSNWLELN